jgi:hypothetical protein
MELELTSARADGTWTWRAAGAREPRGVVEGSVLPDGSKVGDVVRADVDIDVDGITILNVLPPKAGRKGPERLEIVGTGAEFVPVIQTLVPTGDRPRRPRDGDRSGPRPPRGDRPARTDRPPRGDRQGRGDRPPRAPGDGADRPRQERGDRPPRSDRPARSERPPRPPVPELPSRPKAKRLKPVRTHRNAALRDLPDEQRLVAQQVLNGGVPAVRQALQEQNEQRRAAGQDEITTDGVIRLAEDLLPRLRIADWLDRAEGAVADLDELDLRDLRSVVVAGDDPIVARDETTRELAGTLKAGLARRQDEEHREWLTDIEAALGVGRIVRALRLSSRPPKAGVPFPAELGSRLTEASMASLTADASADRWAAVVEALAYSPVRASVVPTAPPATVTDELRNAVTAIAGLVPGIATLLGIEPPVPGSRQPRGPRRPAGGPTRRDASRPPARRPGSPPAGKTAIPPPPPAPTAPAGTTSTGEAPSEAAPVAPAEPVATGDAVAEPVTPAETAPTIETVAESAAPAAPVRTAEAASAPVTPPEPVPTTEPAGAPVTPPEPVPTSEPAGAPVTPPEPVPTSEPVGAPVTPPEPVPTSEPVGEPVTPPEPVPTSEPDGEPVTPPEPVPASPPEATAAPAATAESRGPETVMSNDPADPIDVSEPPPEA